jgi:predicted KAP-like P-loop ATPase
MSKPNKPPVDNPIVSSKDDALDRAHVARNFAKSIRKLDAAEGLVIGVMGPWGSGKTSFINLMSEEFVNKPPLKVTSRSIF